VKELIVEGETGLEEFENLSELIKDARQVTIKCFKKSLSNDKFIKMINKLENLQIIRLESCDNAVEVSQNENRQLEIFEPNSNDQEALEVYFKLHKEMITKVSCP